MIIRVPHIPGPGETILGGEFMIVQGGKGANQAIAAARADGEVIFIACLGDDTFGKKAIIELAKEGVDTSHIKIVKDIPSGVAMINVAETGENSISVAPGANSYLLPDDIINAEDIIASADIVLMQLEIPIESVKMAINLANKHKVPIILNPAPARTMSSDLLKKIDFITPNENEAALLVNINSNSVDFKTLARTLKNSGPGSVIITLGEKGAFFIHNDLEKQIPGYKVNAVDTTAAGDTFNGYLAVSLAKGIDIERAVQIANKAASLCVTRLGAQPSIPFINEVI